MIYDTRPCTLGEGVFWHPLRQALFWFDITQGQLLANDGARQQMWHFPQMVSAAAVISQDELLICGEKGLFRFHLETGATSPITALEPDKPENRSNDGKVDRQGGFWVSTMGKDSATRQGKGAIYRWFKGELRLLYPEISIPNAICFSPDGTAAYFSDTVQQKIWRVALDAAGWPMGDPAVYLDFAGTEIYPDGSTVDAAGNVWNAQWGLGRVACYAPDGAFLTEVKVDAPHSSCPAFGGAGMETLFVTTALEDMSDSAKATFPQAGKVFAFDGIAKGLADALVTL
jgi:sugar lactone lactonase YvrE